MSLKPLEYDLLVMLAKNKNVAFSRDQLLNQVWGSDYLGETRTIDVHIGQLRKKAGTLQCDQDHSKDWIPPGGLAMKLWKKISLLAVLMILLATGIFGAVVLYQTATYSLNQTIAGYRRQVTSNIYAMSQEMKDNSWQQFGETARRSFFQYMLNKYGNNDYMLLQGTGCCATRRILIW